MSGERLSYTVAGAMRETGLGKTRLYELIAAGRLEAVKEGRRTLILGESVRTYLASLPRWTPARAA